MLVAKARLLITGWASGATHPEPVMMLARYTGGGTPLERQAAYRIGSRDLLDAVQGLCKRHGLRCTDVEGTGQHILFERV